jgi:cyanophycinase
MKKTSIACIAIILFLASCSTQPKQEQKGGLFIIGGGPRPNELMQQLVDISDIKNGGYVVILPMSSEEPDSAFFYIREQFVSLGIREIVCFNFAPDSIPQPWIDSLITSPLIFITGGDQNKFMKVAKNPNLYGALHQSLKNGAVIAGTSAGAAIMSKKMITGNEHKYPEYTGNYRTIEAENIEIAEGMGFVEKAIIDQHFVYRMRMNRLITVAIENPEETAIGIDESTAIFVQGNTATVYGKAQVIVLRNQSKAKKMQHGLLGEENIRLEVRLPGESFSIK